jgi:hypothetical protein
MGTIGKIRAKYRNFHGIQPCSLYKRNHSRPVTRILDYKGADKDSPQEAFMVLDIATPCWRRPRSTPSCYSRKPPHTLLHLLLRMSKARISTPESPTPVLDRPLCYPQTYWIYGISSRRPLPEKPVSCSGSLSYCLRICVRNLDMWQGDGRQRSMLRWRVVIFSRRTETRGKSI